MFCDIQVFLCSWCVYGDVPVPSSVDDVYSIQGELPILTAAGQVRIRLPASPTTQTHGARAYGTAPATTPSPTVWRRQKPIPLIAPYTPLQQQILKY